MKGELIGKSVFSFNHVGPRDPTLVSSLGNIPTEPIVSPTCLINTSLVTKLPFSFSVVSFRRCNQLCIPFSELLSTLAFTLHI